MKKWFLSLFEPASKKDLSAIIRKALFWILLFTAVLVLIIANISKCNTQTPVVSFLALVAACGGLGAAIGFIFGFPKSEKYRFKADSDHNSNNYYYSDNTNIEEISDWLTKIILGLTLIKLKAILAYIDASAVAFDKIIDTSCKGSDLDFYVFGYSIILFYFFAGCALAFLWTRAHLPLILTQARISQLEIENKKLEEEKTKLATEGQKLAKELSNLKPVSASSISTRSDTTNHARLTDTSTDNPSPEFKKLIEQTYATRPVIYKDDIQRSRWGKSNTVNNWQLEAYYIPEIGSKVFFGIKLVVRSMDSNIQPNGMEAAFFLHDTFESEIEYSKVVGNAAVLDIVAYEAFVAGVRLSDNTELEIDLNKVKGFPPDFYYES